LAVKKSKISEETLSEVRKKLGALLGNAWQGGVSKSKI